MTDLGAPSHPNAELVAHALAALRQRPPVFSPKWFYDERGSRLFDRICELPDYYPPRVETGILRQFGGTMARELGSGIEIIEPGAGSLRKVRLLLEALPDPAGLIALDVSLIHLTEASQSLRRDFPALRVSEVAADFAAPEGDWIARALAVTRAPIERRALFFPGSTIGNFAPEAATGFLERCHEAVGCCLIGLDLHKDAAILRAAYNDEQGVTASFNLNLLARLNREAGADFDLAAWQHAAIWNEERSRIEMRLIAISHQRVRLAGELFDFAAGEYLITEWSHKWTLESFESLAKRARWQPARIWTDAARWFALVLLRPLE